MYAKFSKRVGEGLIIKYKCGLDYLEDNTFIVTMFVDSAFASKIKKNFPIKQSINDILFIPWNRYLVFVKGNNTVKRWGDRTPGLLQAKSKKYFSFNESIDDLYLFPGICN